MYLTLITIQLQYVLEEEERRERVCVKGCHYTSIRTALLQDSHFYTLLTYNNDQQRIFYEVPETEGGGEKHMIVYSTGTRSQKVQQRSSVEIKKELHHLKGNSPSGTPDGLPVDGVLS